MESEGTGNTKQNPLSTGRKRDSESCARVKLLLLPDTVYCRCKGPTLKVRRSLLDGVPAVVKEG